MAEIRWVQRFSNYRKALTRLSQAVNIVAVHLSGESALDELLKEGLIQRFEYTHELSWKVMKDYAEYQGYTEIRGSRDALRKAFEKNFPFVSCLFKKPINFGKSSSSIGQPRTDSTAPPI